MANSYEIIKYKHLAMSKIINDEKIVELIGADVEAVEDILFKNVFPNIRSPAVEQEEMTYIFITINIPTNRNPNNLMKDILVGFNVVSHQKLLRVKNADGNYIDGSRIDLLSAAIDDNFNHSNIFGVGELKLISNVEGMMDKDHPCRTITFSIEDFDNRR